MTSTSNLLFILKATIYLYCRPLKYQHKENCIFLIFLLLPYQTKVMGLIQEREGNRTIINVALLSLRIEPMTPEEYSLLVHATKTRFREGHGFDSR